MMHNTFFSLWISMPQYILELFLELSFKSISPFVKKKKIQIVKYK